jgi:hypothetical protein
MQAAACRLPPRQGDRWVCPLPHPDPFSAHHACLPNMLGSLLAAQTRAQQPASPAASSHWPPSQHIGCGLVFGSGLQAQSVQKPAHRLLPTWAVAGRPWLACASSAATEADTSPVPAEMMSSVSICCRLENSSSRSRANACSGRQGVAPLLFKGAAERRALWERRGLFKTGLPGAARRGGAGCDASCIAWHGINIW